MTTDVKVGDKVRVVYEGLVTSKDQTGIRVGNRWHDDDYNNAVEVIERAKPKVGDKLTTVADYDAAPVGTIITSWVSPNPGYVKTQAGWVAVTNRTPSPVAVGLLNGDARTVLYIPEG